MKKKLLFVIPAFKHGGTNKSLLNILSCIDKNKYEVSVFSMSHVGPYKSILSQYDILKRYILFAFFFDTYDKIDLKYDNIITILKKVIWKPIPRIMRIITGKKGLENLYKSSANKIKKMSFDTIIAMQEGYTTHFVSYINIHKIAWIRCDYSEYQKIINKDEEAVYGKYDHIICVSDYTKNVFLNYYPSLNSKCYGIHNMIDYRSIKLMSTEKINDNRFTTDKFSIISVGRLSKVKQFDLIPKIAYELKNDGYNFYWYIIGGGEEYKKILALINMYGVEDKVILLGEKNNPYPYINQSSLVVVTSLSEACPNVLNEAKILHVPVVTTDFGSAKEFIENQNNGLIVNKEKIKDSIELMINQSEVYTGIKNNINTFIYSNDIIIEEINKLL